MKESVTIANNVSVSAGRNGRSPVWAVGVRAARGGGGDPREQRTTAAAAAGRRRGPQGAHV